MKRKFTLILLIYVFTTVLTSGNIIAISEDSTVREDLEELVKERRDVEELMNSVHDLLQEKGLDMIGLSYDDSSRIIGLQYRNNETKDQYEDELEQEITRISEDIGLQGVEVHWEKVDHNKPHVPEEEKKRNETLSKITREIYESLKKEGYNVGSLSFNEKEINIQIEAEGDFANIKDNVYTIAKDSIASITEKKFNVNVTRKTEQEKLEDKWHPILTTVSMLAERKFEEYRGFAYSFHPEPLQIIIKTEIKKPFWAWRWLSDYDSKVEEIVRYVDEVIEVKREELQFEEIPYEIIVRSKDNDRLN